jgi:acetolactate synthase-1/3 small subunit
MYDGTTLDAGPRTITVEITGDEQTVDDAIDAFRQFGIRELARTGHTALARGETWTTPDEQERYERQHGPTGPDRSATETAPDHTDD